MDWQAIVSVALTLGVLATLVTTRVSTEFVMMGALTVLGVLEILSPEQLLAGFSNPGLMTVAAMFVVASGMRSSGAIDQVVHRVLGQPQRLRQALLRIGLPVMGLSALINNTPVVATMIPAVHSWSRKTHFAASKLMIPLSYSAILGGTLTLIGTSTNLVVNGQYIALTESSGFSFFSITLIGLPVALVGGLFMWWLFPRWLPDREEAAKFGNPREYTFEVAVAESGPLVGKSIEQAGLRNLKKVYLVEIERDGNIVTAVGPQERLRGGDRLVFTGNTDAIVDLYRIHGVVPSTNEKDPALLHERSERKLVEAVVSSHCECIGETIRESQFRTRYGAVVLAVARGGQKVSGNLGSIVIKPGDTLLLEARPSFVANQRQMRDFLVVNDLDQESPRHEHAARAWAILGFLVLTASTGLLSMLNAALLAAAAMLISGCCTGAQARKNLDLTVLITIAASFALGRALDTTGVADGIAGLLSELSQGHPIVLLLLTYVIVSVLTELISNNAAAILMLPIVLAVTAANQLNPEPYVLTLMMAASASFATPLGYQTNLMVLGPGGYHFNDFIRVGVPMNMLACITTVVVVSSLWPLQTI